MYAGISRSGDSRKLRLDRFLTISTPARENSSGSRFILSLISTVTGLVAVLGVLPEGCVAVAADRVIAFTAVGAGRFAHETGVNALHTLVIRVAQRRHDLQKIVLFCEFRRRACGEFIVDRLVRREGCDVHFVVAPLVALLFGVEEGTVHQFFEKRPVTVDEFQLAERAEEKIALHFLDLGEARDILAHDVICHQGNAVIGAALAVVEIFLSAEVGAPVGKKCDVLPLHTLPDALACVGREVQGDFGLNLLFAWPAVEHMAGAVKLQFAVFHACPPMISVC